MEYHSVRASGYLWIGRGMTIIFLLMQGNSSGRWSVIFLSLLDYIVCMYKENEIFSILLEGQWMMGTA